MSADQTRILYQLLGQGDCGLYMRDINLDGYTVGEPEEIKSCQNSNGRMRAEWINNDEIFISINEVLTSPARIYHYNLKNKHQTLITKPDSKGFGDYVLKYSAKFKKLAYVRDIGWSSSELWVYDLLEKTHLKVKEIPSNLTGIDWSADGRIIFQSGSKEISKISIETSKQEVVARFFSNIYTPFVIDETKMGLVTGSIRVIDVSVFDFNSKQNEILISSSSNDYSAFGGVEDVVFISNRNGNPQVWLRNEQQNDIQLTRFSEAYDIQWLSTSPQNDLIMFNKSGQTNIIDKQGELIFNSENYSDQLHINPVFDVRNNRFFYSIQYDGNWNIEYRELAAPEKKWLMFKGITARPCRVESCIYYFKEKDPYLYKYNFANNSSVKIKEIGYLTRSDEWDVLDDDHLIYVEKDETKSNIVKLNLTTGNKTIILESNARLFSFNREKQLIYTDTITQGNTDMKYFVLNSGN